MLAAGEADPRQAMLDPDAVGFVARRQREGRASRSGASSTAKPDARAQAAKRPGRGDGIGGGAPVAAFELDVEHDVVREGAGVDRRLPRQIAPAGK